jgi:DNA-binding LacI/PurR family transcriptional regulator
MKARGGTFMKKTMVLIGCLLVLALAIGLAGCGEGTSDTTATSAQTATTAAPGAVYAPDGRYPAETVKIGFVAFDPTAEQFLAVKSYLDYLETKLNIDVIYSEAIGNAEGELAFIESCAAAGCKGIIGYFNIARVASVQMCIDKGMYYFGVAEEPSVYDAFKTNPLYLGGWYSETGDYDSGHVMAQALIDAGCKRLVYVSGGRDYGVQMFIDRSNGFTDAVEEAKAAGKDVEIVADVGGWPEIGTYAPAQNDAIQKGFDGLGCSFGAATWYQALSNAGMTDTVKIAAIDAFSDLSKNAWASGQMAEMTIEITSMFGMGIPMLLNALDGNGDVLRENGEAPRITVNRWNIMSAEEYNALSDIEAGGIWCWNADDVLSLVKAINPDLTLQSFRDMYAANSVEDIQARRAAQQQ